MQIIMMITIVVGLDLGAAKLDPVGFLTPLVETFSIQGNDSGRARAAVPGATVENRTAALQRICESDASKRLAFPWKANPLH